MSKMTRFFGDMNTFSITLVQVVGIVLFVLPVLGFLFSEAFAYFFGFGGFIVIFPLMGLGACLMVIGSFLHFKRTNEISKSKTSFVRIISTVGIILGISLLFFLIYLADNLY